MSKIYAGMFRKKNNDLRHMTFVKLNDVPDTFLESKIKFNFLTEILFTLDYYFGYFICV